MLLQQQKRGMAWAGLAMTVFLVVHLLLNLQFFDAHNFNAFYSIYHYSFLRWLLLILFVVLLGGHVTIAIRIRRCNAKARQQPYQKRDKWTIPPSWVSISILFLLTFILTHIVQTLRFSGPDIHQEVVSLFQSTGNVMFYLVGLGVLMMHMQHSLANVLQTLGKSTACYQWSSWLFSVGVAGGFALVPLSVYLGW